MENTSTNCLRFIEGAEMCSIQCISCIEYFNKPITNQQEDEDNEQTTSY